MNWSQLRTVFWLRWRLSWNQWSRRGGALSAAVTLIAVVMGLLIAAGSFVAGVIAGASGLLLSSPQMMLLAWDVIIGVFLFLWIIGVLAEMQRSEAIDLGRLLHLPVSLNWIFVVNYLASHLTLSIIVFLSGSLGLCAGLTWCGGWGMALLVPLVLSFAFMVTAWTYCLRGWLLSLMVNPRRRRSILVGLTLAVVLLGQLPNVYFNLTLRQRNRPGQFQRAPPDNPASGQKSLSELARVAPAFLRAHTYLPPLWVGRGAMGLIEGTAWPAIWGALAGCVTGAAGLARAYRSTMRFYQGGDEPIKRPLRAKTAQRRRANLLEKSVPGVREETAALSLAFYRSLTRAPEVKMALATNLIVAVVVPLLILSRGSPSPGELVRPFLATGAVAFAFFGMLQLMFNQFGFDRDGFRALVLLPIERRHTLLAKNLAVLPMALGIGLALLAILQSIAPLSALVFLAACLQLAAIFLMLSMVGNFVSIVAPYRVGTGSLKPTKVSGKTTLMIFFSHLLFPLATVPIFIPPALGFLSGSLGWWPAGVVNAVLSLLLAASVAVVYRLSLRSLGALLQRREKDILQLVSQEIE